MSAIERTTIEYTSGAKRESDEGRAKISELSLEELKALCNGNFEKIEIDLDSPRDLSAFNGRPDDMPEVMVQRYTKWMKRNEGKYGRNNWEKGIPTTRCMDAILRHVRDYLIGDKSEDHLTAIIFNAGAAMQTEVLVNNDILPKEDYVFYHLENEKPDYRPEINTKK